MATKLYVGNLSFQTTEGDLQRMFEAAGRVVAGLDLAGPRVKGAERAGCERW